MGLSYMSFLSFFQEASSGNNDYSTEFRKLLTFSHVVLYFIDLKLTVKKQKQICATPKTGHQRYCYENKKLNLRGFRINLTKSWRFEQRIKKGPKNLRRHWQMSCWKNLSALNKTQSRWKSYAYLSKTREAVGDNGILPISFFFASCGSLIPFTRANAQWVIHGFY